MSDAPHRIWTFDRYVNGLLMAEGVEITRATSFEDACVSAARLASRGPNGEVPVLVLATPTALAASPEVQAMIREAEARGMERAAVIADRHLSKVEINEPLWHEGQDWAAESIALAIRAEAAALRGKETT